MGKKRRISQIFAPRRGCGHLRNLVVVAYKRLFEAVFVQSGCLWEVITYEKWS